MLTIVAFALSVAAGPIVSAEWLQAHLADPGVCIIDARVASEYARGHIPGARLVDHMDTFGDNHGLSSAAELARVFAKAGVTDKTQVVLYGDNPTATAFVYSALTAIGVADRVSWLDGGINAWRAGKHPVETITPPPGQGTLTVGSAGDMLVDAAWVRAHLKSPGTKILDVRTPGEFQNGHLPGATLILWQDLFADPQTQTFKSPDQIRALLARAGVGAHDEIVTYCAVGMRASVMAFAARLAGVTTHVYLGSWQDWSKDPANPVVRGGGR
jgi:thiosulfate/3-mercaptopyruvate sulfurtransferase